MLDKLMNLLQTHGQESVIDNPQVPNEHNEGVLQTAGSSIMESLKGMIANGQQAEISQLVTNPDHPAAQQIQNNFAENIMTKFGIQGDAAKNIASSLIPNVVSKFGMNLPKSGEGLDLSSIGSLLGKAGLDKDNDGDVDLSDAKKMLGF